MQANRESGALREGPDQRYCTRALRQFTNFRPRIRHRPVVAPEVD